MNLTWALKFLFLVEVGNPFLGVETSLQHRLMLLPLRTCHSASVGPCRACQCAGETGRFVPTIAQGSWVPRVWPCAIVAMRRTSYSANLVAASCSLSRGHGIAHF
ncbi:hypothetical protein HAX54_006936 [Datura stramonium]|uniref:Secreted protein n=1 Tax=Datura stramonium TaxID=4076 RepID=A0ABS8WWY8_DATST|nr:hypothetical protein [Datura stramonium]